MAILLVDLMRASDAPPSQYERLGLPDDGPVTDTHLLVREQRHQAEQAAEPLPRPEDFPAGRFSALSGGMFPTATLRVLAEELSAL
ncbi:hypothetical protein [Streptomyces sp. NPDC055506]